MGSSPLNNEDSNTIPKQQETSAPKTHTEPYNPTSKLSSQKSPSNSTKQAIRVSVQSFPIDDPIEDTKTPSTSASNDRDLLSPWPTSPVSFRERLTEFFTSKPRNPHNPVLKPKPHTSTSSCASFIELSLGIFIILCMLFPMVIGRLPWVPRLIYATFDPFFPYKETGFRETGPSGAMEWNQGVGVL